MATTTVAIPKTKGGAFLIEKQRARRNFHARRFHRRASRHRENDGRVLAKGSGAEHRRDSSSGSCAVREDPQEIRRIGADRRGAAGKIRRHGNGHDVHDGGRRRAGARRLVFGVARRAHRHRHAAAAAVRDGSAEGEVFAEAGDGGNDRGVLFERAAGGLRCAGRAHARRSCRKTASTTF